MAKGKTSSKNKQAKFAAYKTEQRWAKNRRTKLEKLAKVHPNNKQITEALANIKYRRKEPKDGKWNDGDRTFAIFVKEAYGKVNPNIFHANEAIRRSALDSMGRGNKASQEGTKHMFSIRTRAHDRQGNPIWSH